VSAPLPRLMLVTDRRRCGGRDLANVVHEAADGGVSLVQVREKDLDGASLQRLVERLAGRLPDDVRLIVNSAVEVAWTTGAGLHLPAAAPTPERPPALLGRSVHGVDEARRALEDPLSYMLVGTLYETASKPGRPGAGPGLLTRLGVLAGETPLFGIGGITPARVAEVIEAGAYGVAVCGAILEAARPAEAAERLNRALQVAVGG
jgi:thiamine-phosphate pyrophosphorylase